MSGPLIPDEFARLTNVSRETLDKLTLYSKQLARWQKRLNLVATDSLKDVWRRHFLDSAQLYRLIPQPDLSIVDLGSGAGFPGLVLAILGVQQVTLIESNTRKCAFLREVARATGVEVTIFNGRIEDYLPTSLFEIITARALASLENLLSLAEPLLAEGGFMLLLKGKTTEDELTLARKRWHMDVERIPSITDEHGVILKIRGLKQRTSP